MKKIAIILSILLILGTVILSGCTKMSAEKYAVLDKYIDDVKVDEVSGYGIVITIETVGGGEGIFGLPNVKGCRASFGGSVEDYSADLCRMLAQEMEPVEPARSGPESEPLEIPPREEE